MRIGAGAPQVIEIYIEGLKTYDGTSPSNGRRGGTDTQTLALPKFDAVLATGKTGTIPEQHFIYKLAGDRIVEIRSGRRAAWHLRADRA